MNRNEAKKQILTNTPSYLQADKTGRGYICPICGSGSGRNGTGITTKDGIHFTCWAGCFTSSDIFDIIGKKYAIPDFPSRLKKAADLFGLPLDEPSRQKKAGQQKQMNIHNKLYTSEHTQQDIHHSSCTAKDADAAEQDLTSFFLQAAKAIDRTDYHRGLSSETLRRFNIGYVSDWKHPKSPKMKPSPRLIIPTSPHSYLARYAGEWDYIDYKGRKANKSKVGRTRIFNLDAVWQAQQPVFIVEGEIDALSIIDVGGEAIGLGSISNVNRLLSSLKGRQIKQPFIIALDNEKDPEVQKRVEAAVQRLREGFEQAGIEYYPLPSSSLYGAYKDANEALTADRSVFTEKVNRILERIETVEAENLEAEKESLQQEAVAYTLDSFRQSIEDSKTAAFYPTGFPALDGLLDGGLYAGLYCVGAVSSLGKTTFCLQMADHIAAGGKDVLIFSLEMARNELIAKSVSRLTYTLTLERKGDVRHAKSTRGILTGSRYAGYSSAEKDLINAAMEAYEACSRHIYITEGIGDVGIEAIRDKVRRHIRLTGEAPVVLIDYLQILSPADPRATDKQNTDRAVLELKRLSRDFHIPVIGISSFNRDNYTAPVNLASFKESGAIEYSSDVLIGIQYEGMDYQEGESERERDKRIRSLIREQMAVGQSGGSQHLQVKVLKNRNGCKGDMRMDFYPTFNCFAESVAETFVSDDEEEWEVADSVFGKMPCQV